MPSTTPVRHPRRGGSLLLSNALDASGRQAADFATDVLAVIVLGATTTQMGLLNAFGTLAFLVLGVPIGVLVDRSPTVRLFFSAGLLRAGLLASVVIAVAVGELTLLHLYVVAALAGTAAVVVETTQTTIAPRIVGTSGVSELVSRMQSAESVLGLLVPALAGVTVAALGAGPTLATASALSALAAVIVLRLRPTSVVSGPEEKGQSATGALGRFFSEARLGWSTLRNQRTLWRLTLATMLVSLGIAVYSAVEVVLVLRTLGLDATVER